MLGGHASAQDGHVGAARLHGERVVVVLSVGLAALLSWLYLIALADAMDAMAEGRPSAFMRLMPMGRWGAFEVALGFAMWASMMVAMMLPTAMPMVLSFHGLVRRRLDGRTAIGRTGGFVLGYVMAWTFFSAVATALQWCFHAVAAVTDQMVSSSPLLDSILFLIAGGWQLMPAKKLCLFKCRSPLAFLVMEWRDGLKGAVRMGLRHGAYCTGCCWALMALLFVVGVMNLAWIALLSLLALCEKLAPHGEVIARISGLALCGAGLWLLMAAV
jgi:predicted metal-binding membrane protein